MLKRTFDFVVAGVALVALAPFFFSLAILIKVSSPGPVLYRAVRIGRGGRPFVMFKFRSMREEVFPLHIAPRVTMDGDTRITPVGRFLRRSKLDELPQFWNILKGDMSLVGSRPQDPRYFAHYTETQRRVFNSRPGLVSAGNVAYLHEEELLGQVDGDMETYYIDVLMPEKLRLDIAYMANRSLLKDLDILRRAIFGILAMNISKKRTSCCDGFLLQKRGAIKSYRREGPNATKLPSVSVIIPARNAEAIISSALDSVMAQDYAGAIEVIVADGSDSQATAEVVGQQYPDVRLIANPERTTPNGLNAALEEASGQIVVRCDCHATLSRDYVRRAVETLARTGAAVVGGRQRPVGDTLFERAVGLAITTPLGAGDARYRLGGAEGPVDNFYLGVYRRDALEAVSGFDPVLTRGQDAELNWRLRRHGELVWFDPELVVFYRPRGNLRALARQYFDYGRWKPVILKRNLAELRARHLAAPSIALGLAGSVLLAVASVSSMAVVFPFFYAVALIAGAVGVGICRRDIAAVLLPVALATMHLCWGIGFFFPARPDPSLERPQKPT